MQGDDETRAMSIQDTDHGAIAQLLWEEMSPSIMQADEQHHSALHDHGCWVPCPGGCGSHTSEPGAKEFPCWRVSRTVGLREITGIFSSFFLSLKILA